VGEFLTLVGAYAVSVPFTVLAALGLIASTVYALWMIQLTFYGPNKEGWKLPDFSGREMAMMTALIAVILWLGLFSAAGAEHREAGAGGFAGFGDYVH